MSIRLRPLGAAVVGMALGLALARSPVEAEARLARAETEARLTRVEAAEAKERLARAEDRVRRLLHRAAELDRVVEGASRDLQLADEELSSLSRKAAFLARGETPPLEGPYRTDWGPPDLRIRVEGSVVATDGRLVLGTVVDLGTDDGVRQGTTLLVVRGQHFVAKLVVERADLSSARCRVLFHAENTGGPQVGDLVTTRLGERPAREKRSW